MDELQKYVYKQLNIWGVDTYLIYPEYYKTVVDLLNLHISSLELLDIVKRTKSIELYPAVVYIPRHAEKYRWMPLLCYKSGEEFYHIQYHDGWMCRNCWTNNGPVIMPMLEADTTYYKDSFPPIPEIFHKKNCKKCGKTLQNHLIMVDEGVVV